jgi:hypothetical protein
VPCPRQAGQTARPERPVPPQEGHGFSRRRASEDLDLAAEILAGPGAGGRAASASEEVSEEVAEVAGLEGVALERHPRATEAEPRPPGTRRGARVETRGRAGVAEPVIGAPLFGVAEDLVGLLDLLETPLGGLIPRIHIGMELSGQAAIGLLDVGLRGPPGDPENLVIVAFCHASPAL